MDFPVFQDAASMRSFSRDQRQQGRRIAFVPTMGYLHAGHLSLVEAARERADIVVVSIYVNPTQFSANEDFGVYPTSLEEDHRKLRAAGIAAVFQPTSLYASGPATASSDDAKVVGAAQIQPDDHETFVQTELLQRHLCGKSRPHFFKGVATVVAKLFNIVEPDVAVFGSKDYQQLQVVRRMVRDLDYDIEVVGMPIVREHDGLAMSSRNALLTPPQRLQAAGIHQALLRTQRSVLDAKETNAAQLQQELQQRISRLEGSRVDYVEVVDASSLEPVADVSNQRSLVAVAVFFGSVRLIDNMLLSAEPDPWL